MPEPDRPHAPRAGHWGERLRLGEPVGEGAAAISRQRSGPALPAGAFGGLVELPITQGTFSAAVEGADGHSAFSQ